MRQKASIIRQTHAYLRKRILANLVELVSHYGGNGHLLSIFSSASSLAGRVVGLVASGPDRSTECPGIPTPFGRSPLHLQIPKDASIAEARRRSGQLLRES